MRVRRIRVCYRGLYDVVVYSMGSLDLMLKEWKMVALMIEIPKKIFTNILFQRKLVNLFERASQIRVVKYTN